jgi:predicted nuclease with TOPRIM domain
MTEQETQAETTNVEVESQETSKPTFEELQSQLEEARESIKRLESNRDEILKEKRAKSEAKNEVQTELEKAKEQNGLLEENFKSYIQNQMIESLVGEIAIEGSEDLWRHTLQSHVAVDVASQEYNFADEAGNALSKEGLIELLTDKHGQFMRTPKSSGANASGGVSGHSNYSSRVKTRTYADSFGLGK